MSHTDPLTQAQDPSTKPEVLERLARMPDLRQAVAGNPNTPIATLLRLAPRYPREVARNGGLRIQLLTNPEFHESLQDNVLAALVRVREAPKALTHIAYRRGTADLLQALLTNPRLEPDYVTGSEHALPTNALLVDTARHHRNHPQAPSADPRQTLRELLKHAPADATTYERVADASLPHPSWLAVLAQHQDEDVQVAIARSPHAPAELLERMARHVHIEPHTGQALAINPRTPEDALWHLLGDPGLDLYLTKNPAATPALLSDLARSNDPAVRELVAWHEHTPPKVLAYLAEEDDPGVLSAVANHPRTPTKALVRIAHSNTLSPDVAQSLAANPHSNAAVLERAALAGSPDTLRLLLTRPDLTTDVMNAILACLPSYQRYHADLYHLLAQHPLTPEAVLWDLLRDDRDTGAGAAAVHNPSITPAMLVALAEAGSHDTRHELLRHPRLPREALEALLEDTDETVREAAQGYAVHAPARSTRATIPYAGTDLAGLGIHDANDLQRVRRSRHHDDGEDAPDPLTSEARRLAGDADSGTPLLALLALAHPDCPALALQRRALATDWRARFAVALNPSTPTALRDELQHDADVRVAAAASTPPDLAL